jgi:hypothetical protein
MLKEDCRQGNDMAEVNEIWQSEQLLLSIAKMQMQYEKKIHKAPSKLRMEIKWSRKFISR